MASKNITRGNTKLPKIQIQPPWTQILGNKMLTPVENCGCAWPWQSSTGSKRIQVCTGSSKLTNARNPDWFKKKKKRKLFLDCSVQAVCLVSSFLGGAKRGNRKYDRQVILTALRTIANTDLLSNHPKRRKDPICCHYYSPNPLQIQPQEKSSPELDLSFQYMDRERKKHTHTHKQKKKKPQKTHHLLLLQYSASGRAASAAPSALERLQRGRSSWERNKSRIQHNHNCSALGVHLKPHLPRSYFLFSDNYFVKLLCWCVLLYSAVFMTYFPMGTGFIRSSSV